MISDMQFKNALYSIDMGQNDITIAFTSNLTYAQVLGKFPVILSRIKDSVKVIYDNGGQKIWIYNTRPICCLPQTFVLRQKPDSLLDSFGCMADYNYDAKIFNAGLIELCQELASIYMDPTIVYTDKYSIIYDLVANYTKYGFENSLMACCEHGGPPYNYKDRMTYGQPTASPCPVGSRYVSWDGVQKTEVANEIIASKILSAKSGGGARVCRSLAIFI